MIWYTGVELDCSQSKHKAIGGLKASMGGHYDNGMVVI